MGPSESSEQPDTEAASKRLVDADAHPAPLTPPRSCVMTPRLGHPPRHDFRAPCPNKCQSPEDDVVGTCRLRQTPLYADRWTPREMSCVSFGGDGQRSRMGVRHSKSTQSQSFRHTS